MNNDWKNIVKNIAPVIASVLGGPLAGTAVSVVSQALLGRPDGTNSDIDNAIALGGPDALLALKRADQEFSVKMKELDIDIVRINQEDRASAREREKATGDKTTRNLAYAYTTGYFVMVILLLYVGIPESSKEIFYTLIGILSAAEIGIINYYFGSSAGSASKSKVFENMTNGKLKA